MAFTEAARKDEGTNASPPPLGDRAHLIDDWRIRIPRDLATMADAWADAAAWEGMTKIGGGEAPAAVAGAMGLEEVIAHGWDLARATESDVRRRAVDDVDACIAVMAPMSQPGMDAAREPAFGPVVAARGRRVAPGPAARPHRPSIRMVRLIPHSGVPT